MLQNITVTTSRPWLKYIVDWLWRKVETCESNWHEKEVCVTCFCGFNWQRTVSVVKLKKEAKVTTTYRNGSIFLARRTRERNLSNHDQRIRGNSQRAMAWRKQFSYLVYEHHKKFQADCCSGYETVKGTRSRSLKTWTDTSSNITQASWLY